MYFADLHVHTTVSDCSEDVSVILNMAKETGITHIAFTDHDTTKMAPEHISRAEAMESARFPASRCPRVIMTVASGLTSWDMAMSPPLISKKSELKHFGNAMKTVSDRWRY